jgi:outer membrane receptor protein involved in Fe transport
MRHMRWAWLATVLAWSGSALADEDAKKSVDTDELGKMTLTDLLNVDVSVASKVESSAADAPSSVTVFTQEEIRRMGVMSLQELLNFVPGFQSMREVEQGWYETISARGRHTALSESVLVLVDGQRLNDLYTGGAALLNRMLAVENIHQVEIIRGPGSALYGANAFLGVIDVKTLHGVNALWLGVGNVGERVAAVAMTKKVGDLTVDGFVRISESNGFIYRDIVDLHGLVGTQQDRARTLDGSAAIGYKGASLRVRHMAREADGFLSFAALDDPGAFEHTQQSSALLSYERKFGAFEVSGSAGYSEDEWLSLTILAPAGFELAPGFVLEHEFRGGPLLKTRVYSANGDAQWKATDEVTLAAGVAFEHSKYSDLATMYNHDPITLEYLGSAHVIRDPVFNANVARVVFGTYAQATYKPTASLSATAGVRADVYNDFGSSLNPRAAIVYKTPIESRVKVMYGRAFRAPNFLELHDQFNPVDFGNENLTAERIDTIEAAYVQDFGKVFRGTATYFENILNDEIQFGAMPQPDPRNPFDAPSYANSGSSQTRGLELELRAQPVEGLDVYATYSKIAGDDTPRFPRNFGALAVNYATGPVQINVNGIARGKIQSLPDQDRYVIANARVEVDLGSHVAAYINGRNLLDTRYNTPASLIPTGVPNDGRLIMVGLIATP